MKKLIVIFILVFSSIGFSDNITDKLDEAFYYKEAGFLLKAKSIYEEYSPVSQEAKLKLAEFYLEDLQIETGEKLLKELAAQNNQDENDFLYIQLFLSLQYIFRDCLQNFSYEKSLSSH